MMKRRTENSVVALSATVTVPTTTAPTTTNKTTNNNKNIENETGTKHLKQYKYIEWEREYAMVAIQQDYLCEHPIFDHVGFL